MYRTIAVMSVAASVAVSLGCGSGSSKQPAVPGGGGSGNESGAGAPGTSGSDNTAGGDQNVSAGVNVTPKNGRVDLSGKLQFTAVVSGQKDNTVTWSLLEAQNSGSIDATGLYTAPASSGTFHVVAKSNADPTLTGTSTVTVSAGAGKPPVLVSGVWTNLSPPANLAGDPNNTGVVAVALDPSDPHTIYVGVDLYAGVDSHGLWKTQDGGSSWVHLSAVPDPEQFDNISSALDSCSSIAVDPNDPQHVYVTQGVRGATVGFWVSHDGGKNFVKPKGFSDVFPVGDVTALAIDPTDFNHVLLASHSYDNVGVLESKDAGDTWVIHKPPPEGWPSGSSGLSFLYNPESQTGDAKTWLVSNDTGFWRTSDAGATWKNTSKIAGIHGFPETYFTKAGVLYAGTGVCPARSTDNGLTFAEVQGADLKCQGYVTIHGDGTSLYTMRSPFGGGTEPMWTSAESDGTTFTKYKGGTQTFIQGAVQMRFDRANRIMYAANLIAGLWALKVE
jgi:photosystem II stability/assembly factor-like uncharacterized protein